MPPKDGLVDLSNYKIAINGKEMPCELKEFTIDDEKKIDDIDDFGLRNNSFNKCSFQVSMDKRNQIKLLKIIGIWETLKWYQKLWINIQCVFK